MNGVSFLILSILASSSINLVFRSISHFQINKLQAIVVNYLVCFLVGWIVSGSPRIISLFSEDWFWSSFALGSLFIGIFLSMAITTEKLGISVNAVSSKMAVVIPLFVAFLWYKEVVHPLFVLGALLALLSIYFVSIKAELKLNKRWIIFPILVFVGSGIIDSSLKFLQRQYTDIPMESISFSIFFGAFCIGLLVLLFKSLKYHSPWTWSSVLGGIALGLPNYFSIYFLLSALLYFTDSSAMVFALNNVSIVLLSSLLSVVIFKENLSRKNRWGLYLAVISILIIAYAQG